MSLRTLVLAIVSAFLLSMTALAADVTGSWAGKMPTRQDAIDVTLTLKAEGAKLTGSLKSPDGEAPIADGKIDGEAISFKLEGERPATFTGVVAGDELKMKRMGRNGTPRDFVLKRQK